MLTQRELRDLSILKTKKLLASKKAKNAGEMSSLF